MSARRNPDPQRVVRVGGIVVSVALVAIAMGAGITHIVNLDRAGDVLQRNVNIFSAVGAGVAALIVALVLTRLASSIARRSRSGIAEFEERFPMALVASITAVVLPIGSEGSNRGTAGPSLGVRILVVDNEKLTVWGGFRWRRTITSVGMNRITRISVRNASVRTVDYWCVCLETEDGRPSLQFAVDRCDSQSFLRDDRAAVEKFAELLRERCSR